MRADQKRIIITETHRAVSDDLKRTLGLRCLSCTFLPYFTHGSGVSVRSVSEDTYIRISNPSVVRFDGIPTYDLHRDVEKRYEKNIVSLIVDAYDGESEILLAQDNDYGGNLMASLLYHHLLAKGIPDRSMKRIVGLEKVTRNGRPYADIYFGSFLDEVLLLRILERIRIEKEIIYFAKGVNPVLGKGIRNLVALNETVKRSMYNEYMPKVSDGVSLATYLTKWSLDEKE